MGKRRQNFPRKLNTVFFLKEMRRQRGERKIRLICRQINIRDRYLLRVRSERGGEGGKENERKKKEEERERRMVLKEGWKKTMRRNGY